MLWGSGVEAILSTQDQGWGHEVVKVVSHGKCCDEGEALPASQWWFPPETVKGAAAHLLRRREVVSAWARTL